MKRNRTLIGIDPETKNFFEERFPGLKSPGRMRIIKGIIQKFDMKKLRPEITDSKQDRAMKKIIQELVGRLG